MAKARSLVGLDVHATKIVAAVLDVETGELQWFRMSGESAGAAGFCGRLPGPVRAAYEAGPTGYGLARELTRRGVECVVAAPSKIPRASGDRVKTDRRDAEHLARLLLAGELHPVRVPGPGEEALRDLVRAREAVRVDLMRCRHRLSKLLLRHGIRYEGGQGWTERHRRWLATIALPWPAAQTTLQDAIGAVDALEHRRGQLEHEIIALLPDSPWAVQVGRLRCLRGVDTLTAVGLCAEIGDFARFAKPPQLMHYLGLTPSEDTTGESRRLGAITKTGSGHARRLLVEAAWHYRARPTIGRALKDRQDGQPPEAIAIAGPRNAGCTASGPGSSSAPNAARSSPWPPPANSPASAGRSPKPNNPHPPTPASTPSAGPVAAWDAQGTREGALSNQPPGRPRSFIRQRHPTTKLWSCGHPDPRISA